MSSDKKQKRIFHIAKELNISHLEIMKFLKSKDIEAKTHMAPVSGETYELILNEFSMNFKDFHGFPNDFTRIFNDFQRLTWIFIDFQ